MEDPEDELVEFEPGELVSDKNRLLAAILAFLQLLTLGGLGVWAFIDFLIIMFGVFTDANGDKIVKWE